MNDLIQTYVTITQMVKCSTSWMRVKLEYNKFPSYFLGINNSIGQIHYSDTVQSWESVYNVVHHGTMYGEEFMLFNDTWFQ